MSVFFDQVEVEKTIQTFKPNGQLFECRIIGIEGRKRILSGYFKDSDTLIRELGKVDLRNTNVYFTLNVVTDACFSKLQKERFFDKADSTNDSQITRYQWILFDFDPERVSGISSSKTELMAARDVACDVYKFLKHEGFGEPVKALSGNGYHLLYNVDFENTPENAETVKSCLEIVSQQFSTPQVKIDTVNYNPSRICKLHGTLAQKGSNTEDRPHRMSRILNSEKPHSITDLSILQKLANSREAVQPEERRELTSYSAFNLFDFLQQHGITFSENRGAGRDGSRILRLDECPFNPDHRNGDAKIFIYPDGAISFRCQHNSCAGKKWQDVRKLYDPSAYERNDYFKSIEDGWKKHNREKASMQSMVPQAAFRTAAEIAADDEPEHEFIRTGFASIDKKIFGLQKQAVSMISGLRASGKSTIIGNLILQAVEDGHTVVVYSGELSNKKYLSWIQKQAAGKDNIETSTAYEGATGVNTETQGLINEWLGDRFWLYNNQCGNDYRQIAEQLRNVLISKQADICIIDNLMALDLSELDNRDKYEAQTKFVWDLKDISIRTNTHILFVAHPRKTAGFLRLDDVSGSANISNIVDTAFMVHRANLNFWSRLKETFKSGLGIPENCSNVIEIAKDRENGTCDFFVPLWFEGQTKRMLNEEGENKHYGWEVEGHWETMQEGDEIPF